MVKIQGLETLEKDIKDWDLIELFFYKLAENYWFLLWIRSLFSPFVVDGNDVVVAAAVSAVA